MKLSLKIIIALSLAFGNTCLAQKYVGEFAKTEFDLSADRLGVLSLVYDSITLYAQDINAKALTQKVWEKTISYYEKRRRTKQTNKFQRVIGTISSTNLPDGTFDKI